MEGFSPPSCPKTVTVRRNPHRNARPTPSTAQSAKLSKSKTQRQIPSFPMQEILSIDVDQPPPQQKLISENLRVYLRIRPLLSPKPSPKHIGSNKNVWPKAKNNSIREKKTKKKSAEVCVSVNDCHSVTLLPPLALQDFKRIKSEVFEGFSYVFADNSSQNEVYEHMVKPLVTDILNGKSGMIAALGPSGSGKTHTVFGTPRDPGMISLALQDLFKSCDSNLSRSFYISVFEISSERGKVERLSDLSPDGADLSLQQSAIKGLKEIAVSTAAQAELLIAHAMLKRATAMTNSNSQSSRSQCIINIHYRASKFDKGLDTQPINSVLTVVDLAGAEREKRTGNQGSRLLQSNFINNTSMVFGQCLRSLLEHQKNPKRPLQKHFQNSLLTRYLRDYLEGKKRMTLILTVKPGEEDYLDTTYLLRQASPFMKIKFKNVEEPLNSLCKKRHDHTLSRAEWPKRAKYNEHDADAIEEEKFNEEDQSFLEENRSKDSSGDNQAVKPDCTGSGRERSHLIMQNFAKALWNVLKQYKHKLTVAQTELQSLTEDLRFEKTKNLDMEKELKEFKSWCSCSKVNLDLVKLSDADIKPDCLTDLEGNGCCIVDEVLNYTESECGNAFESCNVRPSHDEAREEHIHSTNPEVSDFRHVPECKSYPGKNEDVHHQNDDHACSTNSDTSKCSVTAEDNKEDFYRAKIEAETSVDAESIPSTNPEVSDSRNAPLCKSNPGQNEDIHHQNDDESYSTNCDTSKCSITAVDDKEDFCRGNFDTGASVDAETEFEVPDTLDNNDYCTVNEKSDTKDSECSIAPKSCNLQEISERIHSPKLELSECGIPAKCKSNAERFEDAHHQKDMDSLISETFDDCERLIEDQDICNQEPPAAAAISQEEAVEDVAESHNIDVAKKTETNKLLKPKRRLLPASSVLLRDISALGIGDETEKPKGNRGGKNLAGDGRTKSQGSLSLLRLLQRNVRQ